MASYQELETRLKTIEHKLDMVMKLGSATVRIPSIVVPGEFIEVQKSLLELYHLINRENARIIETTEPTVEPANELAVGEDKES